MVASPARYDIKREAKELDEGDFSIPSLSPMDSPSFGSVIMIHYSALARACYSLVDVNNLDSDTDVVHLSPPMI
jgi:hypothetical protein